MLNKIVINKKTLNTGEVVIEIEFSSTSTEPIKGSEALLLLAEASVNIANQMFSNTKSKNIKINHNG